MRSRLSNQIACNTGMLRSEAYNFRNRAQRRFPGVVGIHTSCHQFGLYFGEIHSATGRRAQEFASQDTCSGLASQQRKNCRRIQDHATHPAQIYVGPRSIQRQAIHRGAGVCRRVPARA